MQASVPEGIIASEVCDWLIEHTPALTPPVTFALIAGGHSNLTYSCTDALGRVYVLRRPPLGHVLESAHDMGREYRIVTALANSAVPVAPTYGLSSSAAVNGAPFFVMDFIAGVVVHDCDVAATLPAAERESLAEHVIDVLVALHRITPASVGLDDLGRHDSYIARQLKRWTRQWLASTTHPIPAMETSRRLLEERMPAQIGSAIVHGDYRLGNFIVGAGRIKAVLDWELCTLGDPLADLGYLLNTWANADEAIRGLDDCLPTVAGGFPAREELAARYAQASGRDVSNIDYYRAFSHWRLAAIRQGVYKRYLEGAMGSTTDFDLDVSRRSVELCAQAALALLSN
jgi:aminoglycoside phosphotransferase (APT) family kinase protein